MLSTKFKIKVAALLSKLTRLGYLLVGKTDSIVRVRRGGFEWELDLKEGIDFAIFLGLYEPATIRLYQKFVSPGDTVLDIGANIGAHALPLAQRVGTTGKVIAFEPTDFAYSKLQKNLQLNPKLTDTLVLEQLMLTDNDNNVSEKAIYSSWPLVDTKEVHENHLGSAKSTSGSQAVTLDTYLQQKAIGTIHFIKLDVDGFECDVLRGALSTLQKHKPIIFMELAPYVFAERGHSLNELLDLIQQAGYQFYQLGTRQALSMDPTYLNRLIPTGSSMNVMACVELPTI